MHSLGFSDYRLDIKGLAKACVEFVNAKLDFGTQSVERVDTLEKLAVELVLSCLRQL
ncbi:MAG TPA: hypothetical protein VFK91_05900 [Methyloceanibacter sp.]|nr:hypothetical protein [Methyloceanibacter sp.]